MHTIDITITSDFICPWCWIGHRHLRLAIERASLQAVVRLKFMPFELNPDMPTTGMDRREYRSRKFGTWEHSEEQDRILVKAGHAVGLMFNYDLITHTPNTRAAHRLMQFAQDTDPAHAEALYERLFSAYFNEGKDTGISEVLIQLAREAGYDARQAAYYLALEKGQEVLIVAEEHAISAGISSVPFYEMEGHSLSGAQPVSVFTEILVSRMQSGF